ncbi:BolA family protein [Kordiimonas sp.]|uniref:BolA family protein n=1 Tax=Kordiimonas sp. TaxID=1970157 RepID=UPI003A8EDAD8
MAVIRLARYNQRRITPAYVEESKSNMGKVTETIEKKLQEALAPDHLEVIDESEGHRGHAGYRDGGESHFRVVIRSKAFEGQSRVTRQRMVMGALKEELAGPIHALSIQADTPDAH